MFIGYAKLDGFRFEEGQMSGRTSRLKALSLGFGFSSAFPGCVLGSLNCLQTSNGFSSYDE